MMPKKPKQSNAEKYPTEVLRAAREQSSEQAKMQEMARRSIKTGKLTKGSRRRIP
jgi:hypothetical protein